MDKTPHELQAQALCESIYLFERYGPGEGFTPCTDKGHIRAHRRARRCAKVYQLLYARRRGDASSCALAEKRVEGERGKRGKYEK